MTACRYVLLALLALLPSLAFAPAPLTRVERRPKPVTKIEGTWQGQSRLLITSTHLTYHPHQTPIVYVLAIDTKAHPYTYDIRSNGRNDGGWDYHGIWRVEGDTLTLCYNGAGQGRARPTSFEGEGKGTFTEVYKRVE